MSPGPAPVTGHAVDSAQMRMALRVLTGIPASFERGIGGARLKGVVTNTGGVVAVFGHGLRVPLGTTSELTLKLRVAAKVAERDERLDPALRCVRQRLGPGPPDRGLQEIRLKLRYRVSPPNLLLDTESRDG